MCPSSPFAFAKTKLVDADLDIFSLKVGEQFGRYLSASEPRGTVASNSLYSKVGLVAASPRVDSKFRLNLSSGLKFELSPLGSSNRWLCPCVC